MPWSRLMQWEEFFWESKSEEEGMWGVGSSPMPFLLLWRDLFLKKHRMGLFRTVGDGTEEAVPTELESISIGNSGIGVKMP